MERRKKYAGFLILAIGALSIGLVVRFRATGTDAVQADASEPPQLVSPADQSKFVQSNLTLTWQWPSRLGANQTFVVRLWYDEHAPVEVWTAETALDVQEAIDSFSQEVGTFYWQVAVIQYSEQNGYEQTISQWSPVYSLQRVRHISSAPFPAEQQSAAVREILSHDFDSTTALIEYTRHFVHQNSDDEWQDSYQPDYRDAVDQMWQHAQGQAGKAYLMCDGQATSLLSMLQEMGIDSHLIFLYGDGGSSVAEHTVLEVFNPDSQQWEVQDPLNDLYFVDSETDERASMNRLVFGDINTVTACNEEGCQTDEMDRVRIYYQAFRVGYSDTFWVNPDRFDVTKRFSDYDGANLAELLTGDAHDFSFVFAPWRE